MRRNVYIGAFVLILLFAFVGGFFAARTLVQRTSGFTARPSATPAGTEIAGAEAAATPAPGPGAATEPADATPTRRPTSTVMVVAAPVTDQPAVLTPEPTWTAGVDLPTSEFVQPGQTPPDAELTPEPSATPIPAYPFVLARSVRYSSNDCPGTYALGLVTDRSGNPLPGVRLKLVDEFGNPATAVTKPGPGDTGRYDFPMGGPARKFFMTVVDEAGRALSSEVEVLHDLPPQVGKNCRWVDWRRTQ